MKQSAASVILEEIRSGKLSTQSELNSFRLKVSRDFSLSSLPSNAEIISLASSADRKKFRGLLSIKPTRRSSGVTVVAVMTKPAGCVGKCIFCPSSLVPGKKTPKSYTGREPSTMRSMMFNYNPYLVVQNRLEQYIAANNFSPKIELILQGGTFTAEPWHRQKYFVKRCYDAVLGFTAKNFLEAKKLLESSSRRVVGLTIETRPDWCMEKEINRMLFLGATRVELGVQVLDDGVYKKNVRGHLVKDVVKSTCLLRDSAFKVCYHLMPGLYGSTPEIDLDSFRQVFSGPDFRPDMVKIYPCLVIKGTPLYRLWAQGKFEPLCTEEAADMIVELKKAIPPYVRIMRIQRDIPSTLVDGGVKKTNLRQIVEEKMKKKGLKCRCIRCREAGLNALRGNFSFSEPELCRLDYEAGGGREVFLSFEDKKNDLLYSFCRFRVPHAPFRKEITAKTGLVRELHVYSTALALGETPGESDFQHKGLGTRLVKEAERMAIEEFNLEKMVIISGLGVREFYQKKLGYKPDGAYMSKNLKKPLNL
ncbi:MAG: tRNA uridine(34) 5-carboxymethylaminomethyl modification radical SAM/GNAT enzyme Elp3 [archaeon]|nr:tRNA uridine(34) 5-carboxymethylaminomethyl modification radical SAM/GNAT enzyme Elp3 [archaeon]